MYVYKITHCHSGKGYIGKDRRPVEKRNRWREHVKEHSNRRGRNSGSILYRAMRKYGIDAFKWEVLIECSTLEELNQKERELIKQHDTLRPNGYNICQGGDGGNKVFSASELIEHKRKCRESALKVWSDPVYRKRMIAAIHAGRVKFQQSPAFEISRERMSNAATRRHLNPEYMNKLSKGAARGAKRRLKSREQREFVDRNLAKGRGRSVWMVITPEGSEHIVDNLSEYARQNGIPRGRLSHAAAGTERRPSGWKITKISHDVTKYGGPSCIATWDLTYPCGRVERVTNLESYCRANGLPFDKIYRTNRYKRRSKDGWLAHKIS